MSRYRKTKIFIRSNEPLSKYDLIQRQANFEDEKYTPSITVNKPLYFKPDTKLEKSAGWINFFKSNVESYVTTFLNP